jgi:3'(2'), 5'-bisphosphate nucleotidase
MASTNLDFEVERRVAIRAVREAARLCRAVRAEISPESLAKKDKSPVTVADFGSQALICRALAEAFPNDPVIAEEDSIELRRPENSPILDQVVRHVRAVVAETHLRAENDLSREEVCGWIDRGGTSQCVGSGRSTRSMGPKGSSAASSMPSRWR